jgi:hypothetical protein
LQAERGRLCFSTVKGIVTIRDAEVSQSAGGLAGGSAGDRSVVEMQLARTGQPPQ